jgi:hypothetical protein
LRTSALKKAALGDEGFALVGVTAGDGDLRPFGGESESRGATDAG